MPTLAAQRRERAKIAVNISNAGTAHTPKPPTSKPHMSTANSELALYAVVGLAVSAPSGHAIRRATRRCSLVS